MSIWFKLALLAVVVGLLTGLGWKVYHDVEQHGYDRRIGEEQKQTIRDLRQNEIREGNLQATVDKTKQEKDNEIAEVNRRLAVALGRLRNRPTERLGVSQTAGSCPGAAGPGPAGPDGRVPEGQSAAGATGVQLSQPDSAWLLGYAANTKRLRSGLKECYTALDAFRAAQPGPAASVPSR